jgi:hypothetical protein
MRPPKQVDSSLLDLRVSGAPGAGAPIMAGMVASKFSEMGTGGWSWILSDMKSVLETGSSM